MQIKKFINSIFSSNTYLIFKREEKDVWLVDPGDSSQILKWIKENKKSLKGILLTHSHFDHIYGVNDFYARFPDLKLYASKYASEGLFSAKINGSLYKEIPFVVNKQDITIIKEGDSIPIWENISVNIFETPGHSLDSLSFQVEKNLFTGDALIPGIKVFTRSKYGNKELAQNSITRIYTAFENDIMIWPGHNLPSLKSDINFDIALGKKNSVTLCI
ncbi:MBL fold metallo-hydrolase [Ancylomarina salipaludis]|uniref:MBL fold metallo-hydrolase n=1 Tax=Ancylomarina salipaludis TaxID=2501299 RepID=A0A4Q1JKN2_9BACT|nr:MBL fold metallo-hydrolase [Ancylomarina salipaludis]RXQ93860.1 MBL fold metallo-hydrolase [Ancylomarina salipaludis]